MGLRRGCPRAPTNTARGWVSIVRRIRVHVHPGRKGPSQLMMLGKGAMANWQLDRHGLDFGVRAVALLLIIAVFVDGRQ